MPPPRRFKAIKLAILMMCVGMLASGCSRLQTSSDDSMNRHFKIHVLAGQECEIYFDAMGKDSDISTGDQKEFKPEGAMEILGIEKMAE